ncbi:MAG: hypothetical protein WC356_00705 [Candidatus Micrarchaeia archaeon]|jgi:hypothetical protein
MKNIINKDSRFQKASIRTNIFYKHSSIPKEFKNRINLLAELSNSCEKPCFLFGGTLRDICRILYVGSWEISKDLDLMVDGNIEELVSKITTNTDFEIVSTSTFGKKPIVFMETKNREYKLSLLTIPGEGSFEDKLYKDFSRSDFSFNTIATFLGSFQHIAMNEITLITPSSSKFYFDLLNNMVSVNTLLFKNKPKRDFYIIFLRMLKHKYRDKSKLDIESIEFFLNQVKLGFKDVRREQYTLDTLEKYGKSAFNDLKNYGFISIVFPEFEQLDFITFKREIKNLKEIKKNEPFEIGL